jgi:hypothetical protein
MNDLRARILGTRPKILTLDVPEWGDATVGVRSLTINERLSFEAENGSLDEIDRKTQRDKYNQWLVRYAMACTCQPDNPQRLFGPEDEQALRATSALAIERICLVAMKVNSITAAEVAKLGEGSGEARNGASPSSSQPISA